MGISGMVGIGGGQTLWLNVVAYPPSPCDATIGFLNNLGQPPTNTSAKTVSFNPGQADFGDLRAASVEIGVGQRAKFSAGGDGVARAERLPLCMPGDGRGVRYAERPDVDLVASGAHYAQPNHVSLTESDRRLSAGFETHYLHPRATVAWWSRPKIVKASLSGCPPNVRLGRK